MPEKLWEPDPTRTNRANITAFARWLQREFGVLSNNYEDVRSWSVDHPDLFWGSIRDYFAVELNGKSGDVLASRAMPGACWFPGARTNFTRELLERGRGTEPAIFCRSESRASYELTFVDLRQQVSALARELRALGVEPGDRVAGYLPTAGEAAVALLASAAIGAVWSSCSPDFGSESVVDRFRQIEPKVLIAADGYRYGGKDFDRLPTLNRILERLTSIQCVIWVSHLGLDNRDLSHESILAWEDVLERGHQRTEDPYVEVAFEHPLWVVYTSGTTGPPKPLVHGHGGVLLELLKMNSFHFDLKTSSRILFYTTTGWIMFPILVSALLTGCSIVLYDGSPAYPNLESMWQICEELQLTHFGTSPSFVNTLRREHIEPRKQFDLDSLECVICTGSPLMPESFRWLYDNVRSDLWVTSISGGTDVVGGLVGGAPTEPVYNGEIQVRCLGMPVESFDGDGRPVRDQEGELVVTGPIPSMPLRLWGDADNRRYQESYFQKFPDVWWHGDLLTISSRGTCIISGRSDATLNRHGVRIGTAEIYRCLEEISMVRDALIVNLELPEGRFFMPLFIVIEEGQHLDEEMERKIRELLRQELSARHLPDEIHQVKGIPYTVTGKKMEVPVKRILMGADPERAVDRGAVANVDALDWFIDFARATANQMS